MTSTTVDLGVTLPYLLAPQKRFDGVPGEGSKLTSYWETLVVSSPSKPFFARSRSVRAVRLPSVVGIGPVRKAQAFSDGKNSDIFRSEIAWKQNTRSVLTPWVTY